MTSTDITPDMTRLELLLREHFSRTEKQLSDMRKDNADFRTQMIQDFNTFTERVNTKLDNFEEKINARIDAFETRVNTKLDNFEEKINARIDAFETRVNTRFDKLETSVGVMQNDITGLQHDVTGLYHWDYWLLSIILVVFAMPQIAASIKPLFSALAEGISMIVNVFRKSGKSQ